MQMPGAQPAYTQSAASQTLSTYTVGTQPASQQGNSPLYNQYVTGTGHVALDPHVRHLGQTQTLSVSHSPSGDVNSVNWPVGTDSYPRPDIGNGLELLSQAANAVARLPLDNRVNVGPTLHSTQLSGNGLPCPSQLLANNYWVDLVSSANLYQSAHEPPAGGIPRIVSVSDGQSRQVVGLPGCGVAVCMAGPYTNTVHPNSSTHALTGAQRNWPVHWGLPPPGYPWNLEHGSLSSVHAPPLATPAQNFPFTHGGDAKRGQSVALPVMTDNEIADSLLPGLPPPPTGPVVFRQSSVVPATAASGS